MQRGSLFAAVLSLLGASIALTLAAVFRDVLSMYTAIGVILLVNAGVRFRIATSSTSDRARDDHR